MRERELVVTHLVAIFDRDALHRRQRNQPSSLSLSPDVLRQGLHHGNWSSAGGTSRLTLPCGENNKGKSKGCTKLHNDLPFPNSGVACPLHRDSPAQGEEGGVPMCKGGTVGPFLVRRHGHFHLTVGRGLRSHILLWGWLPGGPRQVRVSIIFAGTFACRV